MQILVLSVWAPESCWAQLWHGQLRMHSTHPPPHITLLCSQPRTYVGSKLVGKHLAHLDTWPRIHVAKVQVPPSKVNVHVTTCTESEGRESGVRVGAASVMRHICGGCEDEARGEGSTCPQLPPPCDLRACTWQCLPLCSNRPPNPLAIHLVLCKQLHWADCAADGSRTYQWHLRARHTASCCPGTLPPAWPCQRSHPQLQTQAW